MPTEKTTSNRTCFLVDDDEDDKDIFQIALREVDPSINCLTANDGLEALSMLDDGKFMPDFIFLDLNMPRMDGKECLKRIREQRRFDHVPVIIFSTSAAQRDKDEVQSLGANSFITKPPFISTLAQNLAEVFRLRSDTSDPR